MAAITRCLRINMILGCKFAMISALEDEMALQSTIMNNELDWLNSIVQYGRIQELTREIAMSLINTIYADKDKQLTIDFKFRNEYDTLMRDVRYGVSGCSENRGRTCLTPTQ